MRIRIAKVLMAMGMLSAFGSLGAQSLEKPYVATQNYFACIDFTAYVNWATPILRPECVKDEKDQEHNRQQGRAWDRVARSATVLTAAMMNGVSRMVGIGQGHGALLGHLEEQSAGFASGAPGADTNVVVTGAAVADASDGWVARKALMFDPSGQLTRQANLSWQYFATEAAIKASLVETRQAEEVAVQGSERAQALLGSLDPQGQDTIIRACPPPGVGDDLSGMTCYLKNGRVGDEWQTEQDGSLKLVAAARGAGGVALAKVATANTVAPVSDGCPAHGNALTPPRVVFERSGVATNGALVADNVATSRVLANAARDDARRAAEAQNRQARKIRALYRSWEF